MLSRLDVRCAVRALGRSPAFAAAAILSIAIGVGANSAIYSVASALLLHPLPYQDAGRLAILWNRSPGLGIQEDWFSTAQYFDIKRGHGGFDDVAIAIGGSFNLTDGGEPERIGTIRMSSNLLPMLGARAALGRLLASEDDRPGSSGRAVLGHRTWMRRYGGSPGVVGRTIHLNGQPYEVVGVLDASFSLPREVMPTLDGADDADIVLPLPLGPDAITRRTQEDYNILAKLKRGVTIPAAQAEMDAITAQLRRDHPDVYPPNGGLTFSIVPLREQVVGDVRRSVLVLVGAVAFVLLIACANVANLQLARALGRAKELSVRVALGAERSRLAALVLGESLVLAAAGGLLGIGLSFAGVALIRALGAGSVPRLQEISINPEVLLFTVAVSLASAVLFGLVPAVRVGRLDAAEALNASGRGSAPAALWSRGHLTRPVLVAIELALAVVLLTGAGLLVRSFLQLQRVWPGFDALHVLTFELTMSGRKYDSSSRVADSYRELVDRIGRLPGVTSAGAVSALPLSQMFAWGPITVEGRPLAPGEAFINADMRMVAGRYFETLHIPLIAGRLFDEHDTRTGQPVAIVDDRMAQQLWPNQSPLGQRIRTGAGSSPWRTVVGVVGRVKQYTLDGDSRIAVYFPHAQLPARAMNVVARSAGDPGALTGAVRAALRELDPELPMYRIRTMEERVSDSLARRRFATLLLTLFAASAVGLASIGVYGVMAYLVNEGRRDLGIRLALGAPPQRILAFVLGRGAALTACGLVLGLIGATALTRFVSALLFNVRPFDPLTLLAIPAILGLTAGAAVYAPARRAAAIDPLESLRSE